MDSRFQRRKTDQVYSDEHSRLADNACFLNEGKQSVAHYGSRRNIDKILKGKV